MPVAQIKELLQVILRHVPLQSLGALLRELRETQAYTNNQSFRQTVDRIRVSFKS